MRILLTILVAAALVAGCIGGSASEPDQLSVDNQSDASVAGNVKLLDGEGRTILDSPFSLQPGAKSDYPVGTLTGAHRVLVTVDGAPSEKNVTFEPIRDYVQVYVTKDGVSVVKLHGD